MKNSSVIFGKETDSVGIIEVGPCGHMYFIRMRRGQGVEARVATVV